MYFHGKFVYICIYLFFVNGRKSVRSADTSRYDVHHGAGVVKTERPRSHIAGIRYGLNDLNLDKNRSSSNFRHKGFESSNRHKEDRASQTAAHGYHHDFDRKILIPLDLNERKDTTGYSVQYKSGKSIFRTEREYLFAIVTSNGETLWQSKNNEYPNKVIYKVVDGQNKLKVYFPDPMPKPRISSLKVVRPIRDQHKAVQRSVPGFKHRDPSKVAIEITDPHRPGFKFYRYADPGQIPPEALPRFTVSPKATAPSVPTGEPLHIDPSLKVHLPSEPKVGVRRPVPIALPMSINIDEPPEPEPEEVPAFATMPEFAPIPKPEPELVTMPETAPEPTPETVSVPMPSPELVTMPETAPEPTPETESVPLPESVTEPVTEPPESAYEDDVVDVVDLRHRGRIEYLTLNIHDKKTTKKFCFFEDIRTQTAFYFAKKGYLFDKVQTTNQPHALGHDWFYQWKAKRVFAKMVMVYGVDNPTPFVAIFLTNDVILFYRVGYINRIHLGAKRYEPVADLNTEHHPRNVTIHTLSRSGEKINDVSKYEVSRYDVPNGSSPLAMLTSFYHYTFKPAKYVRIKINRRLVWEQTTSMRPQSLYYFKDLNLAVIEFDYHLYDVYKFQSDMWFKFFLD